MGSRSRIAVSSSASIRAFVGVPVLCVDDEPTVLEAISAPLRRHFDVTIAVGAAAGLEALHSNRAFAVVLSDMQMPGMNGAEFLGRVRRNRSRCGSNASNRARRSGGGDRSH